MTDYYGICEAGLKTILEGVTGLSGNVTLSDYRPLEDGDLQFVVLQPDSFDSGEGQSWAMEFKNWNIIAEVFQRYTSESETMTNFRTLRSNIINAVQKYPTLNQVDGVVGVTVTGEGGIRDITDAGNSSIIYYRMQTIRFVIRQQIDDVTGGEYT